MSERLVWFITRPERDPNFHPEALQALQSATENFQVVWARNREVHKRYEEELGKIGIKRMNVSHDGSGGRTWVAMLKTFAYCYVNDEGLIVLTKVGEEILKGNNVRENITKQILTLQYPNAYFLEAGFRPKFSQGFRIRPARFLIKLTNQERLNYYLTKEEITFFVMTAQKDSQLNEITDKIIEFRSCSPELQNEMKKEIAINFDHRERSDKAARDFYGAHSDVAHTFMMITDYTNLVEYVRGSVLRIAPESSIEVNEQIEQLDLRYPFNTRYLISLQRMAENNGLDVTSYKASKYREKRPATNSEKFNRKIERILEKHPEPHAMKEFELIDILSSEIPPRMASKVAASILEEVTYSGLNEDFVEAYLDETNDYEFENKTGEIFKSLGFEVEMRPKPINEVQTEIEILLKYGEGYCGIIDAKNYKKKFPLSANLASHMASEYIPNYNGYDARKVKFFGYVTASEFSGEKNLQKISDLSKRVLPEQEVNGIMLTAKTLLGFLDYCIEKEMSLEERRKLFVSSVDNKAFASIDRLLKK
ncbi:AlwI family type II restriction endonuclease [Halalkalibacter akibai]|uniref:Restriction endonuclease n=1 Tax=Halalkalibacter akibai (strain ATCC 43226 / DSM 21942 / CIP 109018 / JCM 9157 / 1139) TaxID=1236973 RepID=W4QX49_HALA3|nr:AlwI family type II restriction endonuclease [Halalkalibacter akibai]GAE36457.1 hypothetical protein JCM9157_3645 [Halalkalibacter akibai JCM 9157]